MIFLVIFIIIQFNKLKIKLSNFFKLDLSNNQINNMNFYDLIFLLNEEAELKTIKDLVKSLEGKITQEDNWGKKNLAYPIKKNKTANFYYWNIEIITKNLLDLKKKLNFNDKIIRYLLLKTDKPKN